jgi:acetyl esterase/lipase
MQNSPAPKEAAPTTFTYKTVGKCKIKLDVYSAPAGGSDSVAVWIHGGALIMGDRRGIDRRLLDRLSKSGFTVVSIDYRLAPETKLPAILEDLTDAFGWVRDRSEARSKRVVVLGGSAGGYLTLMSGFLVKPRPVALVSFWGYGDIVGPWYSRPDSFYRRQPLVKEADAREAVGNEPISEPPPGNHRSRFYLYCRQNGLWPKEVAGLDPNSDLTKFDRFCPLRNVTKDYPPTLLVHGANDTDVPHEQSVLMDRALTQHGVTHELISIPGAGHGLSGVGRDVISGVHERTLAFLRRYSG